MKFYLGKRDNPQLSKPYYVKYGQLSKKEVVKKENCLYGNMSLTAYDNETSYNNAIDSLEKEGFRISQISVDIINYN
jgi:hypothetical protein